MEMELYAMSPMCATDATVLLLSWMLVSYLYRCLQPASQKKVEPQKEIKPLPISATLVSNLDIELIEMLYSLKTASSRKLLASLKEASPALTRSQINSALYTLLKQNIVTMTKNGVTPIWSLVE